VKPSADVLFRSVAGTPLRRGVLALVLTGMGEDGCRGLSVLKEGDCYSITQSEESCAVYGMPRTVDEAGLADESQPLNKIADRLIELTSKQKVGA
jgi:two-component system chemotaxis response regulator CheB